VLGTLVLQLEAHSGQPATAQFSNCPEGCRHCSDLFFLSIKGASSMLHYAIVFLVIALIAAVLGFGGIAGSAAGIAKILFIIFVVLFIVSMLMGRRGRG
jgi:uncharacterized membrane protein YtjA (UPF0391 family)